MRNFKARGATSGIRSREDAGLAWGRSQRTRGIREIFDNLKAAAETEVTDADVLDLIRRIDVLPFDFQQVASKDEIDAIAVARSLLVGGTRSKLRSSGKISSAVPVKRDWAAVHSIWRASAGGCDRTFSLKGPPGL